MKLSNRFTVVVLLAIVLVGGATWALADNGDTIYACVGPAGTIRIIGADEACRDQETLLNWDIVGPEGPPGPAPPQVSFHAYLEQTQDVSPGTYWKVPFDQTFHNDGSGFDTVQHEFVAPYDGVYQFNTTVMLADSPDQAYADVCLKVGVYFQDCWLGQSSGPSGYISKGGGSTIELNSGDIVTVSVYVGSPGISAVGSTLAYVTTFSGHLVYSTQP